MRITVVPVVGGKLHGTLYSLGGKEKVLLVSSNEGVERYELVKRHDGKKFLVYRFSQ